MHFRNVALRAGNQKNADWFSATNYLATISVQEFDHRNFRDKAEAMCAAFEDKRGDLQYETLPWLIENRFVTVKHGELAANFPVFEASVFDKLLKMLKPICEYVATGMIETSTNAASLLEKTVPTRLKLQCADIAKIHHRLDVAAFIMEALIEQGMLILPQAKVPLCVYGVIEH